MHSMVNGSEQVLFPDSKRDLLFPKEALEGLVKEFENRPQYTRETVTYQGMVRGARKLEIGSL